MAGRAQYRTRQYNLVMACLAEMGDKHFTIAQMEAWLRQAGTPVGAATLYRQLEKLAGQGLVRKYSLKGVAGASYQYLPAAEGCDAHLHLKCESCGRLEHLDCSQAQSFQRHVLRHHGFVADYTKTVIYGLCKECGGAALAAECEE